MIKHVKWVDKKTNQEVKVEDFENKCGLQEINANIANYGFNLDDSVEKWMYEIRSFNDDLAIDDVYFDKVEANLKFLKENFTAEAYEPKCLHIEMVLDGLTDESFDAYIRTVQSCAFHSRLGLESIKDGHICREHHDDYENAFLTFKCDK